VPVKDFHYTSKCVDAIVVRAFNFEFPADLDPIWAPGRVVRSLLFNGLSLTMPYLEPFLVKTMREAAQQISDPRLLQDIRDFNGQEARHYQCHRLLNDILKANGYPELAEIEARLQRSYDRLSRRSLQTRLAYSAGFECMTNGFTNWFINKRVRIFGNSDPRVASFWLMHMIEETEHKTVAFDVYMAVSGRYWPRAVGVLHGSFHVLGYGYRGLFCALRRDGELRSLRRVLETLRETFDMTVNVGPYLLRALLPWHNPRKDADPQWMKEWVAGHALLAADAPVPLVDTEHPLMPTPFGETARG
jgi:predicted metal-dependent hydrolase